MQKIVGGIIIGALLSAGGLYAAGRIKYEDSDRPAPHAAAEPQLSAIGQQLDQMFAEAYSADRPGASVLVAKGDQILLKKGYGLADAEHRLPIAPHMTFRLGSITKQFTAVGILMLQQDGLLKVSDNINAYLPDYPTHGEAITIAQLLQHTSGIPNYTSFPGFMDTMRTDLTIPDLLDVFKDKPLDFKPGSKWNYSNSAYVVLGALIEKLSGTSYADFVSKRIFTPLGMTNSHYGSNVTVIPNRARGYQRTEQGFTNAPFISMSLPHAAGSLLASSEDMLKWHKGLLSGALLPRDVLKAAWTSGVLTSGDETGYGFGWNTGVYEGSNVYVHGGGIPGFNTYGAILPADDIYVIILSNLPGEANVNQLGHRAASLALGKPIPGTEAVAALSAAELADYAGSYQAAGEDVRVAKVEDGKLMWHRPRGHSPEIIKVGDNRFAFEGNTGSIAFERGEAGEITGLTFTPWAGKPQKLKRL